MKGIYLAAFKAEHPGYNIVYQDNNGKRDLSGDMLSIDLSSYDFIIATPPCNFWSKANYRRFESLYSLNTFHLLPSILHKLIIIGKPFIVENVTNEKLFMKFHLFDLPLFIYHIGRHTYWTNVFLNTSIYKQECDDIQYISSKNRQGGENVHDVIDIFLKSIMSNS